MCTFPAEYCEFSGTFTDCRTWWRQRHPEVFGKDIVVDDGVSSNIQASAQVASAQDFETKDTAKRLQALSMSADTPGHEDSASERASSSGTSASASATSKKTSPKRGKKDKKASGKPPIQISRVNRSGRKYITVITGLEERDIDLKKASKTFSNKFACGCSVSKTPTGVSEVVIQGDVLEDVMDYIRDTWSETIDEDDIDVLDDKKGGKRG